jgi:(R,R)-butanediol dehydrogenase/meso-butanediol dehydrogenase/diacetyl reductase
LATALHGVRQSAFKPGDRVVVSGAGPIGLFTIQLLRQGGAGEIIVLEISTQRSKVAYDLGADVVLNPIEEGPALEEKIVSLTNGMGADILYECAGVPVALQNSINYVKKGGGQVMVIGITEKDVPINPLSFVLKEIEMKGCIGYTSPEFQMAIDLLVKCNINTDVMISDIIQLEDIEQKGFKRLIASTDANKILVQP